MERFNDGPFQSSIPPVYLEQQHKIIVGSEPAAMWPRIEPVLFHIRRTMLITQAIFLVQLISTATYDVKKRKKRIFYFLVWSFIPAHCWRRNRKTNCHLLEAEFWHKESTRKYNLYVAVHCRWEAWLIRLLIDDNLSTVKIKSYGYRTEWYSLMISNSKCGRSYEREVVAFF
jgi:hypothetical protein